MPYITKDRRQLIDQGHWPRNAGELTYKFYTQSLAFMGKKPNFLAIATVIGCLVCTVLELYRRRGVPLEDIKIEENGDIE